MNLYRGPLLGDSTYSFARYGGIWGWATWKRSWRGFEGSMERWRSRVVDGVFRDIFPTEERVYWERFIEAHPEPMWDFRWLLSRLANGGITVVPRSNLVANLGFREDATHATKMPRVFEPMLVRNEQWELRHPERVLPSRAIDEHYFRAAFNPLGWPGLALAKARRVLRRWRPW